MARPTAYKPEYAAQAKVMCELGATDAHLAEAFNVSTVTINAWKAQFPEFLNSLKIGKEPADNMVERSLYQRAIGYSHPEDHISNYQGEVTITPTIKHYPPDTTACIFWLKNRKPEQYRANPEPDTQDAPTPVHITVQVEDARK